VVALMTERGYAGVQRFLFVSSAIEGVLAGVGFAHLTAASGNLFAARHRRWLASAAAACALVAVFTLGSLPAAATYPTQAADIDHIADMDAGLVRAVHAVGGPATILRCGPPVTAWYTTTALAWDLQTAPLNILYGQVPGGPRAVVFRPARAHWVVDANGCRAARRAHKLHV
jgi:hypothetical protein